MQPNLSQIRKPNPRQIRTVSEAQEQPQEEARLRRVGRGRKTGFHTRTYTNEHDRIFGKTDIFRNLKI